MKRDILVGDEAEEMACWKVVERVNETASEAVEYC